ncbi:MAG TPA: ABC-2 family transporter protein, partial [Polyangiaceae bacterium]|nr:ABC-2 family transporter protein [Polyangiaceae bacterium]
MLPLFWKLARQSLRAQLEYPANFVLHSLAHLLLTAAEFVALWALFETFGSLAGWSLPEIAVLYGIANASIALADSLSRGFDHFGELLKSGEFDRLLLRPLGPIFQLLARE